MTFSGTRLSFLDLVPIVEGGSLAEALRNAADTVRHCEALGYHRYWVAEHHGMPGVGAAATSVVLAHAGGASTRIRIGAGGVMLPNHAPLQIAEQFGTLDALYPGRIDLGLGRAPGSDWHVTAALRRTLAGGPDRFPQDVLELMSIFAGDPRLGYTAVPGAGAKVELWMLGSSANGAQLAAALGLPFSFAAHIAPGALEEALAVYRETFQPSAMLARPHVMVSYSVFAADSEEKARYLASSMQYGFVAMRSGGGGRGFPRPIEGFYEKQSPADRQMIDFMMRFASIGTAETVAGDLQALFLRTQADEIIVTCPIYDHADRKESIAIAARAVEQALQSSRFEAGSEA
jgi:luciferase family oxidoreductase group 1